MKLGILIVVIKISALGSWL